MSISGTMMRLAGAGLIAAAFMATSAMAEMRQVDVGLAQPLTVDTSKKLKIALFVGSTNNAGLKAEVDGAERKAKELGIDIDVFDAQWDAAQMINQMQNALLRDYNAWLVIAPDGNAVCDMVSKEAQKKNILVSINLVPVCGKTDGEGQELWVPGTVAYIGGNETPSTYRALLLQAIADTPGEKKLGILSGNALNPLVVNLGKVIDGIKAEHPDFNVVSKVETDWSTPQALEKATAMFQTHPDINILYCQYTTITHGAMVALQTKGLAGKVKVYENGGTKWAIDELKKGEIAATAPTYPETNGAAGVEVLAKVFAGEPIPKVVLNDGAPLLPGQSPGQAAIVTLKNVDAYHPEIE